MKLILNKHKLKAGDIILIHSNGFLNKLVQIITKSYWGHSAIYIGNDKYMEIDETGVHIQDLRRLSGLEVSVYRHRVINSGIARIIVEDIKIQTKGKGYDFLAILQLLVLMVFKRRKSNNQQVGTKNRFICTEIISNSYKRMGLKIADGLDYDEIIPNDFSISKNFYKIEIN